MFSRQRLVHKGLRYYSHKAAKEKLQYIAQCGHNWLFSWAIHDVFSKSGFPMGLEKLLQGLRFQHSPYIWKALEGAQATDAVDQPTLCFLISRAVANHNLELALQHLYALRSQQLFIPRETIAPLISLAASRNEARLSIDIAEWYESTHPNLGLGKKVWLDCLIASSFLRFEEGVAICWNRIADGGDISVSERIRMEVFRSQVTKLK